MLITVLVTDGKMVIVIVEISQLGMLFQIGFAVGFAVSDLRQRLWNLPLVLGTFKRGLDIGIRRRHLVLTHGVQGNIDMVRGEEPATPEPVEINSGCILHGTEEICGCRSLEHPALRILPECKIKQLPPHDGLSQHDQGRRRLGVGILIKL